MSQTIYKCAGDGCPGLPYRASDIRHPVTCCTPNLAAITAARVAAGRAEVFAAALRRLADSLDAAAQISASSVGDTAHAVGIIAADRAEAAGAGERLVEILTFNDEQSERACQQVRLVRTSNRGAPLIRDWAASWEAFALRVDP